MFLINRELIYSIFRELMYLIPLMSLFFTHCNIHDLECNVHDSVLLSNKEDTHTKEIFISS